jgi:aminoglycoside phosphotransferase (APT) family kinase protein
MRMHEHEVDIDEPLVRRLLAAQFPEFEDQPLAIVEPWGTDNAIWRLGDEFVVRLPRIDWAVRQVDLEATWLPRIAPYLSVAVPEPVAIGEPGEGYPYWWSVHRWLPGEGATLDRIDDPVRFALALARVVRELQLMPIDGAPPAFNRARPVQEFDEPTRRQIAGAGHLIDADAALEIWERALVAPRHAGAPVWVHGDLEGNCLVRDGRLAGLVDWSCACAGDPAVDVAVVWSPLFTDASRAAFLEALEVDDAMLARARGSGVQQACGALAYYLHTYPEIIERSWHKLSVLGVARRD